MIEIRREPPVLQDAEIHEDGTMESLTTERIRVYDRLPDGTLKELHGQEALRAIADWVDSLTSY